MVERNGASPAPRDPRTRGRTESNGASSSRSPRRETAEPESAVGWNEAVEALPGLVRIAADAGVRSAAWSVGSGLRSVRGLARAATHPAEAGELVRGLATEVADATRAVSAVAGAVSSGVPLPEALRDAGPTLGSTAGPPRGSTAGPPRGSTAGPPTNGTRPEPSLRERGEELLRRSRDVWSEDGTHPAYSRIIDDLAPDEARILLHLLRDGPQPAVDVRTGGPVGMVSSALVKGGMNMIGPRAGVRHLDEVPAHLNNLFRLGLVWFSREQVDDPTDYQVVEAQPEVLEAMHAVRFAKVVRRSIHLTPFGVDFCRTALVDDSAGGQELPPHLAPDD